MAVPKSIESAQVAFHDTEPTIPLPTEYAQTAHTVEEYPEPEARIPVEGTLPFWFFVLVAVAIFTLSCAIAALIIRLQRRREARKAEMEAEAPPPYDDEGLPAYEDDIKDRHRPEVLPTHADGSPDMVDQSTLTTTNDVGPLTLDSSPRHEAA